MKKNLFTIVALTFSCLCLKAGPKPLVVGLASSNIYSGTISLPGQEDRFTFAGTAGQRLYYDALDYDFDAINVQLISPSGGIVFLNGNSDSDVGPFTLTETGTYTLLLKGSGDTTGDYRFRLIDVSQAPASVLAFDTTVNGTNVPVTSASVYRFTGTTGQRLFFDFAATNIGVANVYLFGPQNQQLNGYGGGLTADFEQTLPADGTYVLTIGNSSDPSATNFSFRVVTPNTTISALTLGATVTGSLDEPGEEDRFTFTGTVGQRLYYDALDYDFDAINVQLINPSGAIPFVNGNSDSDVGLFTLTESGTYTLLQKASGDYTNDYSFRLLDLAAAPAITYGVAVTNTLNPQTSAQLYRINGTAGQRLGITNLGASSGNANWYFVKPDNTQLLSDNIQNNLGQVTLPTTGTYALLVAGAQNFLGGLDYQFRVSLVSSASGGTAGFGAVHGGDTTLDQTNSFGYTAPAGLPVYFDALTNSSPVTVQLVAPSGNAVFAINGGADAGPYFLPESGNYRLEVIGASAGSYDFRLLNLNVDSTNLLFGTTYNPTLNPAFRTDIYRFSGTAGQRLYYDAQEYDADAVAVQLFNPEGQVVFINGNSDSDFGPFTLTQSGTYYMAIISQLADDTADYNFRLIDVSQAPAQSLTFDTTVNGINVPVTSASVYRFTGMAGQRLFFDFAATNIGVASVILYGPQNQGLNGYYGYYLNTDFEQTLPTDGTYVLTIGNYTDPTAANFSFRMVTPNTTTNALTLAASVTGSLDEPGEEDRYTFSGTAGQRLYYDALDADNDPINVQLISPSGAIAFINGNSDTDVGPFTLTETGVYTLLLKGSGDTTGDYSFRLIEVSQLPARALTFDTTINGTNVPVTSASVYRFTGTNGQRLFFDFAATNIGAAYVYLYGPQNQNLNGYGGSIATDFEQKLPADGTYVLTIGNYTDPTATNFSFRVVTPNTTTNALTLGATVTGSLDEPGEEDRYTFNGTAGQRLYYDALEADNDPINVQLISPSGGIVFLNGNSDSDVGPFTLTETGTYTLLLKGIGDTTGDYRFRLIDVSQLPASVLAFDTTVNGTNVPVTSASVYRFTGTTGQRLFFDFAATNIGVAYVYLYGPQNQQINGYGYYLYTDFEQTLPADGTYVLTIGNYTDPSATNFSFRVVTPNTTISALTLGATVTGSLDEPGEEDRFTFTGTAGQRLYYDALDYDFDAINVQLISPSGAIPFVNGNSDSDVGLFTLTESGTYTLLQKASGDYTNDYSFRLLDLAAAPAITYGVAVTNTLNPQTSAQLYRINGTAGQRLGITNLGASSGNANWSLVKPDNTVLLSDNIQNNLGQVTLPTTGTYALLVAGAQNFLGGLDYQFRVSLVSSASGGTAGFGAVHGGDTTLDQTNSFGYTAPAGLPVYFDALTNSSPVTVQLVAPSGNAVFAINGGADAGPYFLPESGNYRLEVIGASAGSYDFRLLNLNVDSTNLLFGTTYNPTLNPAFRTDVYRFSGTAGQRLYYDAQEYDADAVGVQLFNPEGQVVFINGNSDSDIGPFTLTQSGTYYLAIISQLADDTADYNFRLIDVSQAPAQSLTFDTTVNGANVPVTSASVYRFTGTAGKRLFFDFAATNIGSAYVYLYGPQNQQLYAYGYYLNTDFEQTLPTDGTYVLTIGNYTDPTAANFSFRVVTPNTTTNGLTLAASVTGSLNEPGEEDRYTFTGTAGQRLYYDALDADNDPINVQLISPSGANPFITGNSDTDVGPFTLTETGTYTLLFKGIGDTTGDYSFRLIDVSQLPARALTFDTTVNGTNVPVTSASVYRFTGTNGQRLFFDFAATNIGVAYVYLYGPQNLQLNGYGGGITTDFEQKLPADGTYVLTVGNYTDPTATNFSFRIVPGNHAPVISTIGDRSVNEEATLGLFVTATDLESDNDQLTFSLDPGFPSGLTISPTTGALSWTPTEAQGPGTYPVTVRVTDDGIPNMTTTQTFNIVVNEVNKPPVLTVPANQTINELAPLSVSASATDPDIPTNALTFALVNPPGGMTINASSGAISWTPNESQGPSTNTIFVKVTDNNPSAVNATQLSVTNTFQVFVNEINVPPVLPLQTNRTINELTLLTVTNTATDSDFPANPLTYLLVSPPPGAAIDANGVITWTPSEAQGPGSYTITTIVTDTNAAAINSKTLSATNSFTVTVNEVNVAPVLPGQADRTIDELTTLSVTNPATDSDIPANTLSYSLVSPPAGAGISSSGVITWTPTEAQGPGTYTLTTIATDNGSPVLSATNSFRVTVNEINVAPVMPGQTNRTINELTLLTVTNTATDSDLPANPLTYSLVNQPSGATIDTNGIITWIPNEAQGPGTYTITTIVTDTNPPAINSKSLTATNSFMVTVNEVNSAPVLPSQTDRAINELTTLMVTNTATDSDLPANALTYTLTAHPAGSTIGTNGVISWIPSEAQGPGTYTFTTVVTDDGSPALSATNSFNVTVNEVNSAPTLGAGPLTNRTVNPGQTISFTATAVDPDIPTNTLAFSLVNPPSGAAINSSSGAFAWRPTVSQANTTNVVQVRVTDNGSPALSDTKQFSVVINGLPPVVLGPLLYSNGQFQMGISGAVGPDYIIQRSTNLQSFTGIATNTPASTPFNYIDLSAGTNRAFYRVLLGP